MKFTSILAAATVVTLAGCSSFPSSTAKQAEEHQAHHPAAKTAPKVDPAKFDQQMKTMQEMHQKMMDAKTPAERTALMKDHMKSMQDGMAMMGQMRGGKGGMGMGGMGGEKSMGPEMMGKRMDMMEMMMQMMMDREATRSSPAK